MALKQSRRSVSLNRSLYRAATAVAAQRGVTLAQLVADALRAQGVDAPPQWHVPREIAVQSAARKTATHATVISSSQVLKRLDALRGSVVPALQSRGGGELRAADAGTPDNTAPEHAEPSPTATSSRRTHTAVAYHASQVVSP